MTYPDILPRGTLILLTKLDNKTGKAFAVVTRALSRERYGRITMLSAPTTEGLRDAVANYADGPGIDRRPLISMNDAWKTPKDEDVPDEIWAALARLKLKGEI